MEAIITEPSTDEIIEAILHSPTGEIDSYAVPIESYIPIGTNALRGYNHGHFRTKSTTR